MGTQRHELVVLHLDLHEEIERAEPVEQRRRARVVVDAVMGDVPCHAHHARVLERFEIGERCIVGDDGDALEAAAAAGDRIERQRLSRP